MILSRNIGNQPIKVISSCIRNANALLQDKIQFVTQNNGPREGDLVLVRFLDGNGAYNHVEDITGLPVRVHRGDLGILVLASRRSGTSLIGEIPLAPLATGARLDLIAQGGLVAKCRSVPAYYGGRALPLEVLAFPADLSGTILNLDMEPPIPIRPSPAVPRSKPLLFVCGTSAEVGKTTLICNLNLTIKMVQPSLRTAAIKASGTGRSRDLLNYLAANYDFATDFVDAGLPSTYGTPEQTFRSMLHTLIGHCSERADLIVVEIGGDFLEGHAPSALHIMAEMGAGCLMMVNDAMGAIEGTRRLKELGCTPLMIGTYKQNVEALAHRLNLPAELVADPNDPLALKRIHDLIVTRCF